MESTAEFVGGGRVSKLGSDVPLPHRLLSQLIRMEGGTGEGWQSREPRVRKERPAQGLGPFLSSRFIPSAPDLPSLTHEDRFTNTELWAREKKGKRNVDRRFVVTASLTICVTN